MDLVASRLFRGRNPLMVNVFKQEVHCASRSFVARCPSGFVTGIILVDTSGTEHTVWTGREPTLEQWDGIDNLGAFDREMKRTSADSRGRAIPA